MSNQYKLTDAERKHISEVQSQLQHFEQQNLQLEGSIRRNEKEQSLMRRHLQLFLGQMAEAQGLPLGSKLASDYSTLNAPEESTTPVVDREG
jgi:hypothetical protein